MLDFHTIIRRAPYILHCWEVAHAVEQYVENPTLAQRIAAWHHDLFEDTDYPLDYHQHRYGEETTRLVQACTGVGSNRRDRQLAIHHQLLQQPQAIDIKLADRAINMRHSLHNARLWKMYQAELPAWDELLAHSNSPEPSRTSPWRSTCRRSKAKHRPPMAT